MTFAVNCQIDSIYSSDFREKIRNDEWWEKFCSLWPLAKSDMDRTKEYCHHDVNAGPCRLTPQESEELAALGVSLKIVPLPGAMVTKMQDRAKWEYSTEPLPQHLLSGAAVQIAIPDFGLMRINEVQVLEDFCTNALQDYLDDGWRILAVCPPNAARRPDYIVGRTKGA